MEHSQAYLIKEIFEQPEVLERLLKKEMAGNKLKKNGFPDGFLKSVNSVCFLACGTSYHAALIGRQYIEKFAKIPAFVELASEFRYRSNLVSSKALVIAISQSGQTTDTIEALKLALKSDAKTLAVVNVDDSPLEKLSDQVIKTCAGEEKSIASTKVYTAQLLALIILALRLGQAKGHVSDEARIAAEGLVQLPSLMKESLASFKECQTVSKEICKSGNLIYLARGVNWPWALEGALKMKETAYIHAEGFSASEVKHGPFALLDKDLPVIFLVPKDELLERNLILIDEIKAQGSTLIAVTEASNQAVINKADYTITIPDLSEYLRPIVAAASVQMLPYCVALLKGLDVDSPRNLTKAVI